MQAGPGMQQHIPVHSTCIHVPLMGTGNVSLLRHGHTLKARAIQNHVRRNLVRSVAVAAQREQHWADKETSGTAPQHGRRRLLSPGAGVHRSDVLRAAQLQPWSPTQHTHTYLITGNYLNTGTGLIQAGCGMCRHGAFGGVDQQSDIQGSNPTAGKILSPQPCCHYCSGRGAHCQYNRQWSCACRRARECSNISQCTPPASTCR